MKTILDFQKMKQAGEKISMLTCYDHWSAKLIATTNIDSILVGDSLAMVMHGHDSTLPATIELMAAHTKAVARGAKHKFIIADMPFLSYRQDLNTTMQAVQTLMTAGAHAIKLEGVRGNVEVIKHIVESGVPVMGHLGLTPQSIHQLGGFRVQGKKADAAEQLLVDAKALQAAGCFSIVLECVPSTLAKRVTEVLDIPTIGIGAGADTDGQVLVLQDMLGVNPDFKPKFLKTYMNGFSMITEALNSYDSEVKAKVFPTEEHGYHD